MRRFPLSNRRGSARSLQNAATLTVLQSEAKTTRAGFHDLPLVVGVSGHRDPPADAEPQLRERFGEVLDGLAHRYPQMPLLVLSGLAAGADIIAAEEALDRGVAVLGCLPMPQAEYEKDFSPEELQRFRRVLPRCWAVIVVGTSANREQNYVDVATFIAYYCHVLVAFWDGLPARGPGGTAEVVELRKGVLPSALGETLVAYLPDTGPVFQIVTPRRGQPPPNDSVALHEFYPQREALTAPDRKPGTSTGRREFESALARLERFNRDLGTHAPDTKAFTLADFRDRTDAAANKLQVDTLRSVQSVFIATALAAAAQLIFPTDGSFNIPSWLGIGIRIGFLIIAVLVLAIAKRSDYENRYQDYRAIAEALRVQCAWCCAGLGNRLVEASYLQMQQSELEWIRLALRTMYLITGAGTPSPDDSPTHPECLRWIDSQIEYYERSGRREERQMRYARWAMIALPVAGGVISASAGVLAFMVSHKMLLVPPAHLADTLRVLTYWGTMPFALGGMLALWIRFYVEQRGFAENTRRYHHMYAVFSAAKRRLVERARDPRKVLEELGHESLSEHAEWLILHRERPLEFVHT